MGRDIGDEYQQKTKYFRDKLGEGLGPVKSAPPFKVYPDCLQRIEIPEIELPQNSSLWKALRNRRSRRNFSQAPLGFQEFSRLIFAAQGVTRIVQGFLFRAAPSAGGLYPIETYLLVNRVESLRAGVYHLNVLDGCLELLRKGDLGRKLAEAGLGQRMCTSAALNFIWTAIPGRSKPKYRERAWRYIYMDAGHICENLYLAAEDLGLGCCGIGAFFDQEVNDILGVDGEDEAVVYLAAVGPLK